MVTRVANGRWARFYLTDDPHETAYIAVTYHRNVKGKLRQLSVSRKLPKKALRHGETTGW